ncbi:restriction endonuclease [Methanolobus tindarius DSM 2278]|uniref:Restriction endonuclease n=1 Tax=Methanolobus tindarius DSM 2278 TaxID=1090322 RepID=W9DQ05_METTI|nr:restriction endonuclease [Methanolobus tindarius]ETA68499.1 restriction endonuclease [Methanolobus tindarius DSM 2278]
MAKWTVEHLLETDPQDFEVLLSQLFSKMGYHTELTQYSRDKGIDLVIRIENFGLVHTWNVQAKRYSNPVGVKDIREYSSIRYRDHVDGVIIVTSSSFTKEAIEEAEQHNLKLIDGYLLTEMLNHYLTDECANSGLHHENNSSPKNEENNAGAILKKGEQVLANETVILGNEKLILSITNKNIFLKRVSTGLFSKRSDIEERIELKNLLGMHCEPGRIILVTGNKKLKLYPLSSKKIQVIEETLESMRPEYVRGEHLIISSRNGTELTLLTNKRLIVLDISENTELDIPNKKIVGVELKGGFLKKEQLIISEDSGNMKKHSLMVENPAKWKEFIEQCVRTV